MQVCTSLQTDNHASTPPLCFLQAGCPSCRPTNSVKALKALPAIILPKQKTIGLGMSLPEHTGMHILTYACTDRLKNNASNTTCTTGRGIVKVQKNSVVYDLTFSSCWQVVTSAASARFVFFSSMMLNKRRANG